MAAANILAVCADCGIRLFSPIAKQQLKDHQKECYPYQQAVKAQAAEAARRSAHEPQEEVPDGEHLTVSSDLPPAPAGDVAPEQPAPAIGAGPARKKGSSA